MSIIIKEKITDNVFGAVWLAALILTYNEIVLKNQLNEVLLRQSDIQRIAQKLCTGTVQSARVNQWCNGDHSNSSYNYLRAVESQRKLTKIGEFNNYREYPENLLRLDTQVFVVEETNQGVTFGELFEWFSKDYSKAIYTDDNHSLGYGSISTNKDYQNEVDATGELQEDNIKDILKDHLESKGWKTQLAMGKIHGIDIDAYKDKDRWIIEVKGCGSRDAMRVNYFLAILGEILQRMNDTKAKYSIALPNMKQYRNLWSKLPRLAKEKTGVTALFVNANGKIEEIF
ncbi:hypothetical protein JCM14036_16660 [Desulfotomaculum defluvii]